MIAKTSASGAVRPKGTAGPSATMARKGTSRSSGPNDGPEGSFGLNEAGGEGRVHPDGTAVRGPLTPQRGKSATGSKRIAKPSILRRMVGQVIKDEQKMERMMRKALRGRIKNIEELISLQVTVYRYAQQVEVFSKMVDRATQAVKQTLQTPM
jgi:hypothetical protein